MAFSAFLQASPLLSQAPNLIFNNKKHGRPGTWVRVSQGRATRSTHDRHWSIHAAQALTCRGKSKMSKPYENEQFAPTTKTKPQLRLAQSQRLDWARRTSSATQRETTSFITLVSSDRASLASASVNRVTMGAKASFSRTSSMASICR